MNNSLWPGLEGVCELHEVEEAGEVHEELQQHRGHGVHVEDVGQRPLAAQHAQRLGPRDEEEARRQQQPLQRRLLVGELDAVQVEHGPGCQLYSLGYVPAVIEYHAAVLI